MRSSTPFILLVISTAIFAVLYLYFSIFPGKIMPEALQYFTMEQILQNRQYNLALRLSFIAGFLIQFVILLWLIYSGKILILTGWAQQIARNNYYLSIIVFFAFLWLLLRLLHLPFHFFSSFYWQHHWDLSTQSLFAWWLDYLKSALIDILLSGAGLLILLGIMNRWHNTWWLAGAVFMSVWLVIQSLLWPVIIAPMFNKFEPVQDREITVMVRDLADKAALPVDQVYIMDASRRTIKANAYFAGVGHTKRVVLYDTLLTNYSSDEIKAVLAHEFAHWRQNHIIKGLLLGIIGNFLFWGILYMLLRSVLPGQAPNPPHTLAAILFVILSLSFISNPWVNYISRSMETEADQIAVELTGDAQAAIRLQKNLALRNFSDLSPAPFIEWFSYSHPPAAKRMDNIRQAGNPTVRK